MNKSGETKEGSDLSLGPAAATSLDDLARHVSFTDKSRDQLEKSASTEEFLKRLIGQRATGEAVRTLAHLLPIRWGVWWGLLCAWEGAGGNPAGAEDRALGAIARWVLVPSEAARRIAEQTIPGLPNPSAALSSVHAVCFAGSAAGRAEPLVPRNLGLAAKHVVAAVFHTMTEIERRRGPVTLEQLLDVGLEIRAGKLDWQEILGGAHAAAGEGA